MINNLFKSIFISSRNAIRFLQMFCLIYSFAIMIYFLISLSGSEIIESCEWLFRPAYNFANLFYRNSMVVSGETIDLTGAFLMFALIGLSFFFKSLYQITESTEDTYYKAKDEQRILDDKQQQQLIIHQYQLEMRKFNRLFILLKLKPAVNKLAVISGHASQEETEKVLTKFQSDLENYFAAGSFQINKIKKYKPDETIIILDNINDFEDLYQSIKSNVQILNKDLLGTTMTFDFCVSLDIGKMNDDEDLKISYLQQMANMVAPNELMTTPTFKFCYELLPKQNYQLSSRGRYNINHEDANKDGDELFLLIKGYGGVLKAKIPE